MCIEFAPVVDKWANLYTTIDAKYLRHPSAALVQWLQPQSHGAQLFRQHANGANRKSEFWCINLGLSGFAGTGCNQRKSADKLQSDVIVPYLCTSSHPGSPASCKGLFQDAGLCNLPTRYRFIPIGGPVGNRMSAATAARSTGTGSIGNRSLLIVDAQTNGRGLEFGVEEIHSSGRKIVC